MLFTLLPTAVVAVVTGALVLFALQFTVTMDTLVKSDTLCEFEN